MTLEELRLRRLAGQHLISITDSQSVVKDLCGLQCQFLSHALQGLSIRTESANTAGMVKSWTLRGSMHLFSADDLPLFLHEGRKHFLRPVDTLESDAFLSARRKAYFADLILDAVSHGVDQREDLKRLCEASGMTQGECGSLFDPWGGIIRALCESGRICHKVQETKAYQLCPDFVPMEEEPARLELLRRYVTHFGPATVRDAAYFFGTTQRDIKALLKKLPVEETAAEGRTYFYMEQETPGYDLPSCLFLAGFDQLMLGYEKTESLFLPQAHIRDIFTRAGIIRPAVLLNGTVAGWWKRKDKNLIITLFDDQDKTPIIRAAEALWPDIRITFLKE